MKERKRRRRERNVEEEEKVEEGKGKRIQSTYREQLLMVFFFILSHQEELYALREGAPLPGGWWGERGQSTL